MSLVVALAIAGLIALIAAVLTGSTWIAVVVIVLAVLGIIVLVRDWRGEKSRATSPSNGELVPSAEFAAQDPPAPVRADMFKPDISTDPDGPSSDARAD